MGTVLDLARLAQASASVVALNQGSAAALQSVQAHRLRAMLASARSGSRLYRERLKGLPDDERALMACRRARDRINRLDNAVQRRIRANPADLKLQSATSVQRPGDHRITGAARHGQRLTRQHGLIDQ